MLRSMPLSARVIAAWASLFESFSGMLFPVPPRSQAFQPPWGRNGHLLSSSLLAAAESADPDRKKGHLSPPPEVERGGLDGTIAAPSSAKRVTSPDSSAARPMQRSGLIASSARMARFRWCGVGKNRLVSCAISRKSSHSSARMPSFASSKPCTVATSGPSSAWQTSSVTTYLSPAACRRARGSASSPSGGRRSFEPGASTASTSAFTKRATG